MACTISTQEQLTKLDSFEAVGLVIGLAAGIALSFYLDSRSQISDSWDARGKLIIAGCALAGVIVGVVAKIVWERFC